MRLLRKATNSFSGQDDSSAVVIFDGLDNSALDRDSKLVNGTPYYYALFSLVGVTWQEDPVVSAVPAATYADESADPQSIIRDRLDLGMQVEVARGTIKNKNNKIAVLTAPPIFEDTVWPVVSVHMTSESPAERGIGELPTPDTFDAVSAKWTEVEGWLSRATITVVGWTLNPDERITVRKILRRLIIANLPVFDDAGMVKIEYNFRDSEDFSSYSAPVYMTSCELSCLAPSAVSDQDAPIEEVDTTLVAP